MDSHGAPPELPFPSIEGGCLAALVASQASRSPREGAEKLLRALLGPLGASGGLVCLPAAGKGEEAVLVALDVPAKWVSAWEAADPSTLDDWAAPRCVRHSNGEAHPALDPVLLEDGQRALWVLPLRIEGRPRGALVLTSRNCDAFPRDVLGTGEAVAAAFAGWVGAGRSQASPKHPAAILGEEADLAVIRLGPENLVREWPPPATRLLGWSALEVEGRPIEEVFLEEDRVQLRRRLPRDGHAPGDDHAGAGTRGGEWTVDLRASQGSPIPCAVRIVQRPDSRESVLLLRDRRSDAGAESRLRWSRSLLSVLGGATVVLDPGGRIREVGDGWLPVDGPAHGEAWRGRHFADLLEADRREVLGCLRAAARKGEWSGRLSARGSWVPIRFRAVRDHRGNLEALVGARSPEGVETGRLFQHIPLGILLLDSGFRVVEANPELVAICPPGAIPSDLAGLDVRSLAAFQTRSAQTALEALRAGLEVNESGVRLRGDGEEGREVHLRGGRLSGAVGEGDGYLLTLAGQSGVADMERHLMRAQKMESIGNLAAGLAHDFGNFVTVILGKIGMLRVKLPSDPHITGDLTDIETAAKRAQHLSQELMSFARGRRSGMASIDLRRLVEEVGALIRTSVGRRIEVRLEASRDLPVIRGDEVELQQMVMNLALNARDAMPHGGRLVIETTSLTGEQRARLQTGEGTEDGICLTVRDTGEGIAPEIVDRIFEPFFTTKDESKRGTGLGLAMVYGTVRRHGGTVDVWSEPGAGTRFEILLPAAGPALEARGARRVLVVDHEPACREMIRLILEEDGFLVDLAADGIEGLRKLRAAWESLSLVILDLRMPGSDGLAVLEEVRRRSASLPVLATTGHAGEAERAEALRRGAALVLEKPYRAAQLRAALAEILEPGAVAVGDRAPC